MFQSAALYMWLVRLHFYFANMFLDVTFFPQFPYLFPLMDIDFVFSHNLVMFIHPYRSAGSLKDLIYGVCGWWDCNFITMMHIYFLMFSWLKFGKELSTLCWPFAFAFFPNTSRRSIMELEAAIGHGAKVSKKSDKLEGEEKKGKLSSLLLFPFFLSHSCLMPSWSRWFAHASSLWIKGDSVTSTYPSWLWKYKADC